VIAEQLEINTLHTCTENLCSQPLTLANAVPIFQNLTEHGLYASAPSAFIVQNWNFLGTAPEISTLPIGALRTLMLHLRLAGHSIVGSKWVDQLVRERGPEFTTLLRHCDLDTITAFEFSQIRSRIIDSEILTEIFSAFHGVLLVSLVDEEEDTAPPPVGFPHADSAAPPVMDSDHLDGSGDPPPNFTHPDDLPGFGGPDVPPPYDPPSSLADLDDLPPGFGRLDDPPPGVFASHPVMFRPKPFEPVRAAGRLLDDVLFDRAVRSASIFNPVSEHPWWQIYDHQQELQGVFMHIRRETRKAWPTYLGLSGGGSKGAHLWRLLDADSGEPSLGVSFDTKARTGSNAQRPSSSTTDREWSSTSASPVLHPPRLSRSRNRAGACGSRGCTCLPTCTKDSTHSSPDFSSHFYFPSSGKSTADEQMRASEQMTANEHMTASRHMT
jgi:hypothetical protein